MTLPSPIRVPSPQYHAAADPKDFVPEIPFAVFPAELHASPKSASLIPLDLSARLASATRSATGPATSPNLLASYVALPAGGALEIDAVATSHMFFVLRGAGAVSATGGAGSGDITLAWASGDLFTLPAFSRISLSANADAGAALYYVHDGPLLSYLGVAPT